MSLVRIVLDDGASVVAHWEPGDSALGAPRAEAVVTLTAEESVESLPAGRVEAILPVDDAVPLPGDVSIFRFATLL